MKRTVFFSCSVGLLFICLLIFNLSFLGCESNTPIRIGFIAGTSGRVADLGISGLDAVQLAVRQCNHRGGIHGRKVQLVTMDDQQNPDLARQAVQELIKDEVHAIVGPMTSGMAKVVTPILNDARMLTVSPTATTQQLSGQDDFFFRVTSTTREFASLNAEYQIKTGDMGRIVAVYDLGNRSYCEDWLANFKLPFVAGGGEILATFTFTSGHGKTFTEIVSHMLASGPDGILVIANSMDSAMMCQQIRKVDTQIPITLSDWGATERLLELGGKAVEGVTVVQTFDRGSTHPSYQSFRTAYLEQYKREPGFPGVYAWDAIQVILVALKAQKKGQSLKETILSIERYNGLQGPFSFDPYGDVKRSRSSFSVVKNGSFVILE
jgi:branched-chain amino acid transport system substrate-binding protein